MKSNKEKLEEAAKKWFKEQGFNIYNHYDTRPAFIEGAKWQAERMYSEIHLILDNILYWDTCPDSYKISIKKWLEQFKKK